MRREKRKHDQSHRRRWDGSVARSGYLLNKLSGYPEWQRFINTTYSARFGELIEVIDLIAFNSLDKKILNYLEKKKEALNTSVLLITHQQIATELNTHREAVSRLLRTMEKKGLVKLGRNTIALVG